MRLRNLLLVGLAAAALAVPCTAFYVSPPPVSISRLTANARRYIRRHPDSADAHYTLARLHYLAFSTGMTTVRGWPVKTANELPNFDGEPSPIAASLPLSKDDLAMRREQRAIELADEELRIAPGDYKAIDRVKDYDAVIKRWERKLEQQNWTPATSLPVSEMADHAARAVDELNKALKLSPENPRYLLMLASLTEDVATWCEIRGLKNVPQSLQPLTYETAKQTFLWAYRAARASEPELTQFSDASIIAKEAGDGYLRLAFGKADPPPTDVDSTRTVDEVESGMKEIKQLNTLPNGEDTVVIITPIIFSLEPSASLTDLLAPGSNVDFDLRGYGPRLHWPWVRPQTAMLVWDPLRTGDIVSGQQLFGGYTFQVFRRDGYEALEALDDNGDGMLSGDELRGIRAWFDRNGDGRSDPGEVVDLQTIDVISIATTASRHDGASPMNPAGLRLRDGRILPTWDWTTAPASGPKQESARSK